MDRYIHRAYEILWSQSVVIKSRQDQTGGPPRRAGWTHRHDLDRGNDKKQKSYYNKNELNAHQLLSLARMSRTNVLGTTRKLMAISNAVLISFVDK